MSALGAGVWVTRQRRPEPSPFEQGEALTHGAIPAVIAGDVLSGLTHPCIALRRLKEGGQLFRQPVAPSAPSRKQSSVEIPEASACDRRQPKWSERTSSTKRGSSRALSMNAIARSAG
jgi:hypothetical protein